MTEPISDATLAHLRMGYSACVQEVRKWQLPIDGLIARLDAAEAENKRLRDALDFVAEEHDAGRHDGLPEPCPAHDAETMWGHARKARSAS